MMKWIGKKVKITRGVNKEVFNEMLNRIMDQ